MAKSHKQFIIHSEKLVVEYDNGEMETVTIAQTEPDGDFGPPTVGATLCVKSRGGKYSATIKDVLQETHVCITHTHTHPDFFCF